MRSPYETSPGIFHLHCSGRRIVRALARRSDDRGRNDGRDVARAEPSLALPDGGKIWGRCGGRARRLLVAPSLSIASATSPQGPGSGWPPGRQWRRRGKATPVNMGLAAPRPRHRQRVVRAQGARADLQHHLEELSGDKIADREHERPPSASMVLPRL